MNVQKELMDQRNNFIFQSNIKDITDKVKLMKFDELHEQLKIYDYENGQLKQRIQQLEIDIQHQAKQQQILKSEIEEKSSRYEEIAQKYITKEERIKIQSDQLEELRIKIKKLNKEKLNTLEYLEYNNSKSHANVKLIYQLYQGDSSIKQSIEQNMFRSLKRYDENENFLKRELNKNSLFLEEFAKLIVYLKNSFENKNQKIQELHHSLKVSQMFQPQEASQNNLQEDLQSISEQNFGQMNQQKIEELQKKIEQMADNLQANNKIGFAQQIDDYKDKFQKQQKKLIETENKLDEQIIQNNEQQQTAQNNIRALEFLNNEIEQMIITSNKKLPEPKQSDQNKSTMEPNQKNFKIIIEYKIDFIKEIMNEQQQELSQLKEDYDKLKQQKQTETGASQKIQRENIKKLNKQIEELMLEKEEIVLKYQKLEKVNKQVIRNNQKRQVFDFSRDKMMAEHSNNQLNILTHEIEKKDVTIQEILSINQSLIDRIAELEKAKLEVLREKQHCKKLFEYFNEKATEIHIMSENLSKILRENKKLRRFIEELYLMLQTNVKTSEKDIQESLKNFDKVQIEIMQSIIMASSKKGDFDATLLKTYLEKEGKNTDPRRRRIRNQKQMTSIQGGPTPKQIQEAEDREFYKVLKALNELDSNNLRQSDYILSKKLNRTIVENITLKQKLEKRSDQIIELKTDIIQFKKKVKFIYNLEKKIEKIVEQNMKLKTVVHKLQKESIKRVEQNSARVLDFGDKIFHQNTLVSKLQQKLLAMKNQINNLERRVQILKTQHQTIVTNMQVMKEEHSQEVKILSQKIRDQHNEIQELSVFEGKYDMLKENFAELKNELGKEQEENSKLSQINQMLEKHLFQIASRNKDGDNNLIDEIKSYKKKIEVKTDQQLNLMQEKINLEYEIEKQKEQIFDLNVTIKQKQSHIEEKNKKIEYQIHQLQIQMNATSALRKNNEKLQVKVKNLTNENHKLKDENSDLQRNLQVQDTIINNNIKQERGLLYQKIKAQFIEEFDKQEKTLQDLQNKNEEMSIKLQKQNGDVDYLRRKLQMRNRQLLQFNSFMSNMMEIPNPDVKENSKMVLKIKDQIKEIDRLKNQNKQLQMLYKNLQNNIDNYQITPPTQEQNLLNSQIMELKTDIENTQDEQVQYKQKIQSLITFYEEKEVQIQKEKKLAHNKYILAKNKILSQQKDLQEVQYKLDETKMQVANLTEQNFQLMKESNASKKQLVEIQKQQEQSASQSEQIKNLENQNENLNLQVQQLSQKLQQQQNISDNLQKENANIKLEQNIIKKQLKEDTNEQKDKDSFQEVKSNEDIKEIQSDKVNDNQSQNNQEQLKESLSENQEIKKSDIINQNDGQQNEFNQDIKDNQQEIDNENKKFDEIKSDEQIKEKNEQEEQKKDQNIKQQIKEPIEQVIKETTSIDKNQEEVINFDDKEKLITDLQSDDKEDEEEKKPNLT